MKKFLVTLAALLVAACASDTTSSEEPSVPDKTAADTAPPPKYKAAVPESILTPNTVETSTLGTLRFFDGMPSADTVAKTDDYFDVARAAEAFLAGVPIASAYLADPPSLRHHS